MRNSRGSSLPPYVMTAEKTPDWEELKKQVPLTR
jgi:hypothetical protein